MARNMYPGTCYVCGAHVPTGHGHFQRNRKPSRGGKWLIKCVACASGRCVRETDREVIRAKELRKERDGIQD